MGRQKKRDVITLVIPVRGDEPLLQRTIDNAVCVAGCEVDVVVVDNGMTGQRPVGKSVRIVAADRHGTSAARHVGMMAAKTDVVVQIDAHVRLDRFWGKIILKTFRSKKWQKSVACGHVGNLDEDFQPEADPCYHGARINWMDTSAEPRFLVARWDAHTKPGEKIGAIMGAYYALRRDWYNEIGRPWAINRSWGCDEEVISLASYLSGGDCRLLPEECRAWHRFNRQSQVPYELSEHAEMVINRMRLLAVFPFTDDERSALCAHAGVPDKPVALDGEAETFASLYVNSRPELEKYLTEMVTGYAAWKKQMAVMAEPVAPVLPHPRPFALPTRTCDICPQCDARDSFVVTHTYPTFRRYKCSRCGRKAWRKRDSSEMEFGIRND